MLSIFSGLLAMQALAGAQQAGEEKPEKAPIHAAAIFPFEERGAGVREYGPKVTDILFAKLAARPEIVLVDRTDLKKTISELELNISGVVKQAEANKIGQLTGAKIMISGSVLQVDKKTYLVARIIGTETSRVLGVSVDGRSGDELGPLAEQLAEQVAETIVKKSTEIVAKPRTRKDRIAFLNTQIQGTRPSVMVQITERHVGGPMAVIVRIDPAAETEFSKFAKDTGFALVDPLEGPRSMTDVMVTGEGISETASRHGNLVSVKARVEIKAVDRKTGKILVSDRQTAIAVDLTENIAGKTALQNASAILAERILPQLVK
jgi:TolB-like protein